MQVDVEDRLDCGAPVVANDVVTVGLFGCCAAHIIEEFAEGGFSADRRRCSAVGVKFPG
jgi:hypothetical protein